MPIRQSPHSPLSRRSSVIAVLGALASFGALADEPSPWYIGASEAITHDSNVNRLSSDIVDPQGRSDNYSSTGLLGGFDQAYGRQHFYGRANVAYNKYQNHGTLDNTSYGLGAGWDWTSIWDLSGGVNISSNQALAQLNGNAPTQTLDRNLVRSDQFGANLNYGGPGAYSLQGAYTHSRVSYSLPSQAASDSAADTGSLGVYYRVGPTLTTGIAYRLTRTTQSATDGSDLSSNGRNIDLSADYRYSVQTGVNARLSFTRQTDAGGGGQTFSGLTGSLGANYAPTGKLSFNAAYARDAGTNGSFFNVPITSSTGGNGSGTGTGSGTSTGTGSTTTGSTGSTSNNATVGGIGTYPGSILSQNSTVANTFTFGANYAATAKIGANAAYTYRNASVNNTFDGTGGTYQDKDQIASIGVSWAVLRAVSLGCNISHEKRNVDSVPSYGYSANVFSCSGQVTLR